MPDGRRARAEAGEDRDAAARPEPPGDERVEARREAGHRVAQERLGDGPEREEVEEREEPHADRDRDEASRGELLARDAAEDLVDERERREEDRDPEAEPPAKEEAERDPDGDEDDERPG